jgi:hypothetical protein
MLWMRNFSFKSFKKDPIKNTDTADKKKFLEKGVFWWVFFFFFMASNDVHYNAGKLLLCPLI